MDTIHVQNIGDKALLPRSELERLVESARRHDEVGVHVKEDDLPTTGLMCLAEQGGSFAFWIDPGEDIYSEEDGEPL
ncbi:MAG: hypothetical protein AB1646_10065 [Thermodesulfobacteriota bacterium]